MIDRVTAVDRSQRSVGDPAVTWLTCLDDQLDHAVAEQPGESVPDCVGELQALCGATFAVAPPACVPRPPCANCAVVVRVHARMPGIRERLVGNEAGRRTICGWWRWPRTNRKSNNLPVPRGPETVS